MSQSRNGRLLGQCLLNANPVVVDLDHPESPIRLGPQADVRYIAVSPDGRWAATGSHWTREGIKVWSLPEGRFEKQFPNTGLYASPLFSPDGRWLTTNLGNELCLWTVGEWRAGPRFEGGGLAFSPDGRLLAVAQLAGSVRLFEAETGRLVASLDDPQQSRSRHATFSPDGSRLILASEDSRAAHVWDLRAIRRGLFAMDLDWDWPPLPEPDVTTPAAGPLRVVTDLGGHDFAWGAWDSPEVDRLNEALEIDPGDLYAMLRRGWISISMGRYDRSIPDYTRALAIRPGDPGILARRGQGYLRGKHYALGFTDCEASLAANPGQPSIQNDLAWAYVTATPAQRDPAKAVTHARSAVRLSPEIATYHNTLGIALYRLGQYSEAVIELETSLAAAPREFAPYDLFFLAMCHAHLGDTAKAKGYRERAIRLQAETRLPANHTEELQAFRVEAEALLGGAPRQDLPPPR